MSQQARKLETWALVVGIPALAMMVLVAFSERPAPLIVANLSALISAVLLLMRAVTLRQAAAVLRLVDEELSERSKNVVNEAH